MKRSDLDRFRVFHFVPFFCVFLFVLAGLLVGSSWTLQGDLKTFLCATSDDSCSELHAGSGRLPPLNVAQRITMCGQIALGMEHIADRGLTHRDLAARNVLLSPSLHLKVCPSRAVMNDFIHQRSGRDIYFVLQEY